MRLLHEANPVVRAVGAAFEVVHQHRLGLRRQREIFPAVHRLGHQRVVIRVAVAENEALLAIRDRPVHHARAEPARRLADETLRHVDAVVENDDVEFVPLNEPAHGEHGEQRGLEVTAQHRLRVRFAVEIAAGKKPQRARERVFAHGHAVELVSTDVGNQNILRNPLRLGEFIARHRLAVTVDRQIPRLVVHLARSEASVAETTRAARDEIGVPIHAAMRAEQAGGKKFVAQQKMDVRAAQRERDGEHPLDGRDAGMTAGACRDKHARSAPRRFSRRVPDAPFAQQKVAPLSGRLRTEDAPRFADHGLDGAFDVQRFRIFPTRLSASSPCARRTSSFWPHTGTSSTPKRVTRAGRPSSAIRAAIISPWPPAM